MPKGRGHSFLHDRFLHYFLGRRLVKLLELRDGDAVSKVLEARDLGPGVAMWVGHDWAADDRDLGAGIEFLNELAPKLTDEIGSSNATLLAARLLDGQTADLELKREAFAGDSLAGGTFRNLSFIACKFWYLDISGTTLEGCRFLDCEFADVRTDSRTSLRNSRLEGCTLTSIEVVGERTVFSPGEIEVALQNLGASVGIGETAKKEEGPKRSVASNATDCVEELVRLSERTCDVSTHEIDDAFGKVGRWTMRTAREEGVLRNVEKNVSGPHREFVRFTVDREKLLRGQLERTGKAEIDSFWDRVRERYPHRN